jgi:hypothetical protein
MTDETYGSYGQRMFFELVGPRLERFVEAHNLKLEKWFKETALWALELRHPRGGAAQVVVGPQGDFLEDVVELTSSWQVDDYESETRRIAWGDLRSVSVEEPLLEDAVLEEIRRVLAWTESDLTPYEGPKGIWHAWISKGPLRSSMSRFRIRNSEPRLVHD